MPAPIVFNTADACWVHNDPGFTLIKSPGVLPSEEEHIECVPVPKWHQPPDETTNGVDVGDMNGLPLELADDFLCTQTGPITGICVWASWYNDFLDPDSSFILRLVG